MGENRAIFAVAGGRKTEQIVESAIAEAPNRVLILTYTNENQRHITQRIQQKYGSVPTHVEVMGWLSFLISQCIKPYQRALTNEPLFLRGLNFDGERSRYIPKNKPRQYFFDRKANIYRNGVSDCAVSLDSATNGEVIGRLEDIYQTIYIDEIQDLVGYDLDLLELLMNSKIALVVVGDPRQHTLSTNRSPRNKKYRGPGLAEWFERRSGNCKIEYRVENYRCNQKICDFANDLFPEMPCSVSVDVEQSDHAGIIEITKREIQEYVESYKPVPLRDSKRTATYGVKAINIGVAKGCTYDRVIIFPTKPIRNYLSDRDASKLKAPERLYVAVTRARHSVAFVMP